MGDKKPCLTFQNGADTISVPAEFKASAGTVLPSVGTGLLVFNLGGDGSVNFASAGTEIDVKRITLMLNVNSQYYKIRFSS